MADADDANGEEETTEAIDILLVEPNPGDTRLFTENFRDAKLLNSIHAVADGEAALDYLRQRGEFADAPSPDLVLLEPQLPDKNGAEIIDALNADPELSDVPVIVLTSSAAGEHIVKSQGLEADSYLQKPVEAEDFVDFVRSVEEFWFAIVRSEDDAADD